MQQPVKILPFHPTGYTRGLGRGLRDSELLACSAGHKSRNFPSDDGQKSEVGGQIISVFFYNLYDYRTVSYRNLEELFRKRWQKADDDFVFIPSTGKKVANERKRRYSKAQAICLS